MKKLVLILTFIFLVGCSSGTYEKAMEQGKLALANGEVMKALSSFELALNEKPNSKEAKAEYESLNNKYKNILQDIDYLKGLVNSKDYLGAQDYLIKIRGDKLNKEALEIFSRELDTLESSINVGISQMDKEKETEKVVETQTIVETQNTVNTREVYKAKLDDIERKLSDISYIYTTEIYNVSKDDARRAFEEWDFAINDIYKELKAQLPTSKMEKLRDAQRKWIKEKDSAASSESSKYAKGSEEKATQEYITKARVTRDRCYELLKYYMY